MSRPIVYLIYRKVYHAADGIFPIGAVKNCFSVMGTVSYRVIIMNAGFLFSMMPIITVLNIAIFYAQ
ncbi:hypothetical protein BG74_08745 [Sodalis-like endosymbiont of Proechinophthirus fluctus]|nr:hypothetical protein BG74_08745 [Sodalis-like endosymbiont of Proechinophthirus fluctus]